MSALVLPAFHRTMEVVGTIGLSSEARAYAARNPEQAIHGRIADP